MKPNEQIGAVAYILMCGCLLIVLLHISLLISFAGFLGVGFFGLIGTAFCSYWGLTTFNDWVEKTGKENKK